MESSSAHASKDSKQNNRLFKMTLTLMLITLNELVFFAIPDFFMLLGYSSFVFFVMNMNKGKLLVLYMLYTGWVKTVHFEKNFFLLKMINFSFLKAKNFFQNYLITHPVLYMGHMIYYKACKLSRHFQHCNIFANPKRASNYLFSTLH